MASPEFWITLGIVALVLTALAGFYGVGYLLSEAILEEDDSMRGSVGAPIMFGAGAVAIVGLILVAGYAFIAFASTIDINDLRDVACTDPKSNCEDVFKMFGAS